MNAGLGSCCARPVFSDWSADNLTNKRCAACGAHFFGYGDDVRFFTRREWDAWIEEDAAKHRAETEARNKHFFRARARICETCNWRSEITETHAFCSREETMAHGWNRRESTCEEHCFKVPNVKLTGEPPVYGGESSERSERG